MFIVFLIYSIRHGLLISISRSIRVIIFVMNSYFLPLLSYTSEHQIVNGDWSLSYRFVNIKRPTTRSPIASQIKAGSDLVDR